MNKKIVATLGTAAMTGLMLAPMMAFAQTTPDYGLNSFNVNVGKNTDLKGTIANLINIALGFLGILSVLIIMWGGFSWMTSGGEDKKVQAAKARIVQGIIGLVIILSSWAIASFVLTQLATAAGGV